MRLIWKKRPWSKRVAWLWSKKWRAKTDQLLRLVRPMSAAGEPKVRIGGAKDGGYVMLDPGNGGIALSLGVSPYSPWDLEMATKGFTVLQYDGTVAQEPDKHPLIKFHKMNVTGQHPPPDGYRSIRQIMDGIGDHPAAHNIILQMDIEGFEWDVFASMTRDDIMRFSQIIVEIHDLSPKDPAIDRKLNILQKISETHQSIHVHYNNYSHLVWHGGFSVVGTAMEVSYRRRDPDVTFMPCDDIFPTPLDTPNSSKRPDIPIGSFSRYDLT